MKQKLMVVCGGQSSEHIVSRMSCTSVMNNLNKENYDVTLVGIDQDGSWYILDQNQEDLAKDTWLDNAKALQDVFGLLKQQDVVLPILHGAFGEDGTIQGLFELAGVPYVGCRVLASAVSMDKIYTKKILETAGIPQVKSLYVKKRYDGKLVVVNKQFDEIEDIEKTVEEELGFPCFIKASRSGSSVGCYRCDHKEDLMTKLIEASKYDRHIVVEECVDCIELETAVLGNDDPIVSRVGQIMPHGEFYTFESKYEDEESKTCIPALVDQEIQDKIREYALKVFGIERGNKKPRKDISKWSDVMYNIGYMYDDEFYGKVNEYPYQVISDKEDIAKILDLYISKYYNESDDKQTWFDKIKELAVEMGYAGEVKEFKANPGMYKAHVGDVSTVLRVALTARTNTPDMYEIMQVLGKDRIAKRLKFAKENLK